MHRALQEHQQRMRQQRMQQHPIQQQPRQPTRRMGERRSPSRPMGTNTNRSVHASNLSQRGRSLSDPETIHSPSNDLHIMQLAQLRHQWNLRRNNNNQ